MDRHDGCHKPCKLSAAFGAKSSQDTRMVGRDSKGRVLETRMDGVDMIMFVLNLKDATVCAVHAAASRRAPSESDFQTLWEMEKGLQANSRCLI